MFISIKRDLFVPVRSGRSIKCKEDKGVRGLFFLFLQKKKKTVFLGLHGIYSISVTNQYQLIWQIFHSVRSSALWRGLRHALSLCTFFGQNRNQCVMHASILYVVLDFRYHVPVPRTTDTAPGSC